MKIWNRLLTKFTASFCAIILALGMSDNFFTLDYLTPQNQMIPRAIANRAWLIKYINAFPKDDYIFKLAAGKLYFSENPEKKKDVFITGHVPQEHLVGLLKQYARPNTTAIDAGAYIGTTVMALSEAVGNRGRVIAFETRPKIFNELFHNLVLNQIKNVRLYWGVLAAKNGTMELSPDWALPDCTAVATKALDYFRLKNISRT